MNALSLLVLAGCWTSSQPSTPLTPDGQVTVELAAVTLGDDCNDTESIAPPVARDKPSPNAGAPMPADICVGCAPIRPHCDQTSMQLALRAATPVQIKVKKVELLDGRGAFLATLEARTPMRWNGESYVGWTQTVDAGGTLNASYLLSSPNWDALTNGRWSAHTKTFQLRVTLAIGSAERTVDKQSITPAMLEPPVPT